MSEPQGPGYAGRARPAEPFISEHEAIKAAGKAAQGPHPFETAPRVVITDESEKGPDQAKKPTSWVPDQKVAYGPIGAGLALLIQQVGARYGFDMSPTEAIVYAMLLIALVQFWLPKKDGS